MFSADLAGDEAGEVNETSGACQGPMKPPQVQPRLLRNGLTDPEGQGDSFHQGDLSLPGSLQPGDPIQRGRLAREQPPKRGNASCLPSPNSGALEIAGDSPPGTTPSTTREISRGGRCSVHPAVASRERSRPSGSALSSFARRLRPLRKRKTRGSRCSELIPQARDQQAWPERPWRYQKARAQRGHTPRKRATTRRPRRMAFLASTDSNYPSRLLHGTSFGVLRYAARGIQSAVQSRSGVPPRSAACRFLGALS